MICRAFTYSPDLHRCNLVLLELSVRHFVSPGTERALCKTSTVGPAHHAAAQCATNLCELLNFSEGRQTACKVLQRGLREICVRIARKLRTVDCAFLKSLKNPSRLFSFLWSCWIINREEHWYDSMSNRGGSASCILIA